MINCEINLILTWSANYFIIGISIDDQAPTFAINDTKFYNFVTLSTQNNANLLHQLKLDFKRTIKWNKYQSKATMQARNQYLDYLIDTRFQGVNRLFILSFEHRTSEQRYFLPMVEIKDYSIMIDGKKPI